MANSEGEWGIAERDLAMDDPPVILRDDRKRSHPALRGDASLSRFLVIEALHHAAEAGRYVNRAPKVSIASAIAEVERSFTRLDVEEPPPPVPVKRLYGGHGCIVTVHTGKAEAWVSAPDRESYQAAVAAIGGLRWEWTEQEARHGAFFVRMERLAAQLAAIGEASAMMRKMIAAGGALTTAYRAKPPWPAPPLDPRLADLVTRAFIPYEGLLPPAAAAFFVEAASFILDAYPSLYAWTNAFLGKPRADDVARAPEPVDPELAAALAKMSPAHRKVAEGMAAAGAPARLRAWVGPRQSGSSALARASGADHVILHQAEQATQTFLAEMPRPPADQAACEEQLFQIVRRVMASMLAGVVGTVPSVVVAGHAKACEGYERATAAFACFEGDSSVWRLYYGTGGGRVSLVMSRLEVSEDDADERIRAFLEALATTIESSEEVAALRRAAPSLPAAPLRAPGRPAKGFVGRRRKN